MDLLNPLDFETCNLCDNLGTIHEAQNINEIGTINSNVYKFKEQKFTVWRCIHCHSLHSKESVDLNKFYIYYPMKSHKLNYLNSMGYRNRLIKLKDRGLKKEHKILDFGCGSGNFLLYMRQKGYDIHGYDAFTKEYSDKKVLTKKYDIVTSYDVIEHFNDPQDFFNQVKDCLKREGKLVVGTPNADGLELNDPYKIEYHQPYHRHIFSKDAFVKMADHKGFQVQDISDRWYYDTLFPFVNARFLENMVRFCDNVIDPPSHISGPSVFLKHPILLFNAFLGYFFPPKGNMVVYLKLK